MYQRILDDNCFRCFLHHVFVHCFQRQLGNSIKIKEVSYWHFLLHTTVYCYIFYYFWKLKSTMCGIEALRKALAAADLWFLMPKNANFSQFFLRSLRSRFILSMILLSIWPKTRSKMTFTSTFNTFNDFLPPLPFDKVHAPQGQILEPPLERVCNVWNKKTLIHPDGCKYSVNFIVLQNRICSFLLCCVFGCAPFDLGAQNLDLVGFLNL